MADTEVFGRGIVELSGLWTNHPKIHPTQNYWVFCWKLENALFRKLDLFPSSGEGRHLLCWVPQKGLISITWPDNGQSPKILSIIHHHQNPVESTYSSHCYTYWNHFQMQWRSDMSPLFWVCYMTCRQGRKL
jgi:hypothetical protein